MVVTTILGCGTSTGVPVVACHCKVCRSKSPKNKRLRASIWWQTRNKSIVIDTGPDFRQQALRAGIERVDAVLYSHPHADHCHGIDDLRAFNFIQKGVLPVYGNAWTEREFQKKFPYAFSLKDPEGGGIPQLGFQLIPPEANTLDILGVPVTPLPCAHGSHESLGYRIDSVAYVTDTSYIPASTLDRMKDLSVLILDCVRIQAHPTHLNVDRALEVVSQLRPKRTFLTHLGHDFDYNTWSKKLPKGVALAYDGLKLRSSE
jgi:phosphoribosyl 1,2-cyclic phosphate phosphodiesterase